ncbi:MAG: acetoacetyl-CoA reductase [Candidatus Competibacteraceae bacterium]|nr:acetoacetyl-CoA reductase [Candidatus Competibacteraceae bacterium]
MPKVAIVTGGNGGLGKAICTALAHQGRVVVAAYHSAEEEQALLWQESCKAEGYDISVYPVDVADFDSCAALVAQVEADIGPVEILINNAAVTRDSVLKKMDKTQWDAVINTNLNGAFNMTKHVFGKMIARGWGRIVNMSSMNAQKGQYGQCNYAAAKAGIHGFTLSIAAEGARNGVTVNTVSPGHISSELTKSLPEDVINQVLTQIPVGRLGSPEDVARAVTFFTADEAGFITGATLNINGGAYFH